MKKLFYLSFVLLFFACTKQADQNLVINDLDYFEEQGVNVLVYSNDFNGGFNDEKNSGIEIIHHGVRTVQGGAVRLSKTPEQWDLVPKTLERTVNRDSNYIAVDLRYEDYDFNSRIVVTGKGKAVEISVYLDKPVPDALTDAGFNLEFLPSQYWQKTYVMDGQFERLPRYSASATEARPNSEKPRQYKGFKTYNDRGTDEFVDPEPLATGHSLVLATDSPERMISVTSTDADLELYDGRILAQNGWYVLHSPLPKGKTGKVLTWTVEPNAIPGWVREPNIGFSQVGYLPDQQKVAVIELDKVDKVKNKASILRVNPDGTRTEVFSGKTQTWGRYYKYNYVKFDFSSVTEPGVYCIQYGDTRTGDFIIANDVYSKITDATSDVWIPVHMNHMTVNEGYRVWHGEPFKEGYLQAPPSDHFDLHSQGQETETKYKPYELIPGLNVGGYFDAGDFDIETGSNIGVVQSLVRAWDLFHSDRDETFVSEEQRFVDLHRPDGKPDILEYIEHGTLNLVAQAEKIGHMASCLSNGVLYNYHHLGDISAITDGMHYDRSLKPYQRSADGKSSGLDDDMWAFTTRNPMLDTRAVTMFAAASRALKGYDDDLANRALAQSERLAKEAEELMKNFGPMGGPQPQGNQPAPNMNGQQPQGNGQPGSHRPRRINGEHDSLSMHGFGDVSADLQLYMATKEEEYRDKFLNKLWTSLDFNVQFAMQTALDAVPYMDDAYKEKLKPYVVKYKQYIDSIANENPYGVPIGLGNWAGSGAVVTFGTTVCYAYKYYPEIIDKNDIYRAANYLFGCHPYHNYSLVAAIGAARPKAVFYGNNRADFSFIPGNVAPGVLFRKPDHFENYDDWPFLWGQNEGTIANNTAYLIWGCVFKDIAK